MIIGFDAKRIVRNTTGLGNYCRTLVNDLTRVVPSDWQLRLYAPDSGRDDLRSKVVEAPNLSFAYPGNADAATDQKALRSLLTTIPVIGPLYRSFWRIGPIVGDLQRQGVQIYHGLTGELPRGLRQAGIPAVVTIHDLIFMRHPEYYHWIDRQIYEWKFRVACREATRIIAISECTKRDIIDLGGVDADRIDVIYQSCSPRFAAPAASERSAPLPSVSAPAPRPSAPAPPPSAPASSPGVGCAAALPLPRRFILSVGTIEARKNIALAVKALPLLPADVHLVAVGRRTKYSDRVLAAARQQGLAARVHFLHGVSDADLQAIYQQAEAFVYPSRYEGFGIPIIEAIFSGLPVVAATGSCLEEAGGPDSLYVSPDDPAALAAAVAAVLKGAPGREQRIAAARRYVARFEGNNVATQVLNVYQRVMSDAK